MKLTRVTIKNWRSVKHVDFYPEDITVLLGPNNAGKTNILSAIAFLLGDRWPTPASLEPSDYYKGDRTKDIYIYLSMDHPVVGSVEFDTSRERYVFQAYRHDSSPIYGFSGDQREELSFAYVDAARSFDRQFGTSKWSLFGQAVRRLHEDLSRAGQGGVVEQLKRLLSEAHNLLKTELYQAFESELRQAFAAQLKTAGYDVSFEFRTLDETNLYRSLYPTLMEAGTPRSPAESGSGIRNLLVLALFQAVARAFKGGAVLAIEEPELYLHPHAQRSLMASFEELAAAGNQVFVSTHSAAFVDVTRSERLVLVERCADEEDELCTQGRTTTADQLLARRLALHPGAPITHASRRAFLRGVASAEMAEAFFARLVVIVEGPSEREALPLLLSLEGFHLDQQGVSIVVAGGKAAIDNVVHVYAAHGIPTFVIFDNDDGGLAKDQKQNQPLCRMLGIPEADVPRAHVGAHFAILNGNWERQVEIEVEAIAPGRYAEFATEARNRLGLQPDRNKPLVARYVANRAVETKIKLPFVTQIAASLKRALAGFEAVEAETKRPPPPTESYFDLDDEIPF